MKYLNKINSPKDLKNFSKNELPEICDELRGYITDTITEIGGHLAPTLGAIEITTALHYVFNSPEDKIIWDTGHQAYAHKILTGRFNQFSTIRKINGLSGFLKRSESEHDFFGAGHASTSISAGIGFVESRELNSENFKVVSVIGDGAMSGGLAFEAINNIGHQKKQFLLLLNDNDMSISPNVGAFRNYLLKISTNRYYNALRSGFAKLITKFPRLLRSFFFKAERSMKSFFLPVTIFEELGFRYFGPVDGHNVEELVSVFNRIKDINSPVVLHAITKKGKGIDYAEKDPVKFHGVKQKENKPSISSSVIYQNVFGKEIVRLAKDNKDIVAITAAMKEGTGLVEFAEKYPNRFFDVGIAEAHAVTFAGGLAASGKIPIVAIYSTFLQRAFDQIIHDIALQKLSVIFCLDRSGLVGEDGATHHGVLDISYLKCIPGMIVTSPKDGDELKNLLFSATTYNSGPVTIRYPKDQAINYNSDDLKLIPKGSWEVLKNGENFAILAVGSMVWKSMDVAKQLQSLGFNIEVVNCRFIKPLDEEYLKNAEKRFRKIITIEEGNLDGGFCESILSYFSSSNSKIDILTLGLPNNFVDHGTRNELLEKVGLDNDSIKLKIESFIKK